MMNMAMPRDEESGKVCAPEAGGSR